jgi:hypothetical protein
MIGGEVNCNDEMIKYNMILMSTLMIVKKTIAMIITLRTYLYVINIRRYMGRSICYTVSGQIHTALSLTSTIHARTFFDVRLCLSSLFDILYT